MVDKLQAIRGMHDLLPDETDRWQVVESRIHNVLRRYGYREIRTPLLEKTELFCRSIGEATDIVEKEMYSFRDRNEDALALRPEGTASCVRACVEHGMLREHSHRLWYSGPMFRRERPQKGRYRQFYQVGVETFGLAGPDIDAELILMSARIWRSLGLTDLQLQINSLGTPLARTNYRDALQRYLSLHANELDSDSQRRLQSNPLRILDSKVASTQQIVLHAPSLLDYLDDESKAHFESLQRSLQQAAVPYTVNPCLVRGLDYYTKTVFEWVTNALGAQGTVCAGGRFDGLVEQLGGPDTPAAGFAIGLDRLMALLPESALQDDTQCPHAYLIMVGDTVREQGLAIAEQIREQLPTLRLQVHCGGGNFKKQFKHADRSGARWALILGEEELQNQTIGLKCLRENDTQKNLAQQEIISLLGPLIT